jgi:transcription initiation factor IIE alpha subunit
MEPTPHKIDTYVIDTLMRDLVGHDRRPSAFIVYLCLTAAAGEKRCSLSYAQIAERTGLSKRAVQDAIVLLRHRELVRVVRGAPTEIPGYEPMRPWRRSA